MALLIMVDSATAIQEQMLRHPFSLRISEGERDSWAFFNFWCCQEIWFGLNRTGHPDWVKMFGDFNGQIKLCAKQKIQVSFCYKLHEVVEVSAPSSCRQEVYLKALSRSERNLTLCALIICYFNHIFQWPFTQLFSRHGK